MSDGVELSESVRALVHDHFTAFSQIQDVNHFRAVFLRKRSGTCSTTSGGTFGGDSDGRSLQQILDADAVNLSNFFEELTRPGVGLSTRGISGDDNNVNGNNSDAAAMQRGAKVSRRAGGGAAGVSCAQFVALLHGLKLIAVKSAGSTSSATSHALTPAGIEEVRAVRIFLSCLPMDQSSSSASRDPSSTTSGVRGSSALQNSQQQELRLPQFVEALLRTALSWRERAICRGRYDVCPGQMSSDACTCQPDHVDYAFDVFRDAVQEVLARIHMHRLARAQRRATLKMASVRSVRLPGMRTNARMSVVSTTSVYGGAKDGTAE